MLNVLLASPRGFCAGVRRAISIVEETLKNYGAPVYVRHEIVHNKHVISDLEKKGAIFVNELDEITDLTRPVIFSAHGVSKDVFEKAKSMGLKFIDATCPLVEKVHRQVQKLASQNKKIIIIGKANHPEIVGTKGQVEQNYPVYIINSKEDIAHLPISEDDEVGFVTQTTLSIYDTKDIVEALKNKYPKLESLKKDDICFATTNRQHAVKEISQKSDVVVIIGSKNSSNSKQLREVAEKSGVQKAVLIDDAAEMDWSLLNEGKIVGVSAGASAPEYLVENLQVEFQHRYGTIDVKEVEIIKENVNFKL